MAQSLVPLAAFGLATTLFFAGRKDQSTQPQKAPQKPYITVTPKNLTENAIEAWAAYVPKGEIKPFKYEPRPLGDYDVEIKITHCGICHSDIHQIDNGWANPGTFPMVPGHEIVGVVTHVGSKATLRLGERVGVGAQALSCLQSSCHACGNHIEQYCSKSTFTYNSAYPDGAQSYGGYATRVRVHEKFAIKIPDSLPSAEAAPLLCAGATVYEPLMRYHVGKGQKVGVVAIGGLGHLAIQFAAALGAEVTAISTTANKKELATKLGATNFISTPEEKKAAKGTLDLIVCTDNVTTNVTGYLQLLKTFGTLVLVGIPEESLLTLTPGSILFDGRSVTGSLIASPSRLEEMMKLAAEKNVRPMIKEYPISQVNEAIQGVREGKPRFRYVLKIQD